MSNFLVSNAGTHPELAHAASALARAGNTVTYATSLGFTQDSVASRLLRKSPWLTKLTTARQLPPYLSRSNTQLVATGHELLFELISETIPSLSTWACRIRNRRYEMTLSRKWRDQIGTKTVLVGQATNSLDLFRRAKGIATTVLNYPLPHPKWISEEFLRESIENPRWAFLLQHQNDGKGDNTPLLKEIELADFILVASSFVAKTFEEMGIPRSRLIVLPLAAPSPPEELGSRLHPTSHLQLLFMGQVNQRKGIGYLLEALEACEGLPVSLTIAGPVHPRLNRMLSTRAKVNIVGPVRGVDVWRLYLQSDALILPTLADGFGLVCAEAFASGLPVLATDRCMAADFVRQGVNGLVFKARSTSAIVEAISYCVDNADEIRSSWRASALETAGNLTWSQYGSSLVRNLASIEEPM